MTGPDSGRSFPRTIQRRPLQPPRPVRESIGGLRVLRPERERSRVGTQTARHRIRKSTLVHRSADASSSIPLRRRQGSRPSSGSRSMNHTSLLAPSFPFARYHRAAGESAASSARINSSGLGFGGSTRTVTPLFSKSTSTSRTHLGSALRYAYRSVRSVDVRLTRSPISGSRAWASVRHEARWRRRRVRSPRARAPRPRR